MKKKDFSDGFTVLIPVYHKDDFNLFKRAIKSILENTLKPSQIVIVIDGPINFQIRSFLKDIKLKYKFIDLLWINKNIGLAKALNKGLKIIRFPWVVRADADDLNHTHRFEYLAKAIKKNPNIDLIGSFILEVDENGKHIAIRSVPLKHRDIISFLPFRNPFNHMSIAYRLEKVIKAKGYPDIFQKEDYALWATLISKGAITANLEHILVNATAGVAMYRRRSGVKSILSEVKLQKILVSSGFQNIALAPIVCVIRSLILLLPIFVKVYIYEKFLRRKLLN